MTWNRLLEAATEAVTEAADAAAGGSMDMLQMLDTLLVVMLLGCGAYAIFSAAKLRKLCYLFPNNFIYPGDCKPDDCVDVPGFIFYIFPRLLMLGIGMLLLGGAAALNMLVLKLDATWIDIASIVLPLLLFAWYIIAQRRAAKRFW